MKQPLPSEKTAKHIIIFGAVGLVAGVVFMLANLFSIYGDADKSGFGDCVKNCKTTSLDHQIVFIHVGQIIIAVSVIAIICGGLLVVLASERSQVKKDSQAD